MQKEICCNAENSGQNTISVENKYLANYSNENRHLGAEKSYRSEKY
jgi:hypothetical protein